ESDERNKVRNFSALFNCLIQFKPFFLLSTKDCSRFFLSVISWVNPTTRITSPYSSFIGEDLCSLYLSSPVSGCRVLSTHLTFSPSIAWNKGNTSFDINDPSIWKIGNSSIKSYIDFL